VERESEPPRRRSGLATGRGGPERGRSRSGPREQARDSTPKPREFGSTQPRKVLISPNSLGEVDRDSQAIEVHLTKEQVKDSPPIETHRPVSRQYEAELSRYYGYPYYWPGPYLWGPVPYPATPPPVRSESEEREASAIGERQKAQDRHLRSAKEVSGYYIETLDGEIGHVEDFVVEDRTWAIRYIVVDTRNWWPGKKVIVSPEWIRSVSWSDRKVYVDLEREKIKEAPEYSLTTPITRDYETRVHRHYGRRGYWSEEPSGRFS
jgi:stress response protein YsnF